LEGLNFLEKAGLPKLEGKPYTNLPRNRNGEKRGGFHHIGVKQVAIKMQSGLREAWLVLTGISQYARSP
jgi:hypothetical protein